MSTLGYSKNVFGRSYIYVNPNSSLGPSAWRLSSKDLVGTDADDDSETQSGSAVYDANSTVSAQRGTPLAFTSTGTLIPAIATSFSTASVVGLALNSANPGQTVIFSSDADLSFTGIASVTDEGNSTLSVGSKYYLSATNPGNFTTTPDTTTSGNVVIVIGTAVDTNRIAIEISQPLVI